MEFLEKLAALVPPPRIHLTRFHGVLAGHARWRKEVVPKQEKSAQEEVCKKEECKASKARIGWAKLLKRVFDVDMERCSYCGGEMKAIAAIVKVSVVKKILEHLKLPSEPPEILPARVEQFF